ncbi:MAG: hypothetical protein K2G93_07665 [Rikenella sp.]|nr:hypothetical protein [Rikenella sp.]
MAARLLLSEPPTAGRATSTDEVARHRSGWRRLARPLGGISKPLLSCFIRRPALENWSLLSNKQELRSRAGPRARGERANRAAYREQRPLAGYAEVARGRRSQTTYRFTVLKTIFSRAPAKKTKPKEKNQQKSKTGVHSKKSPQEDFLHKKKRKNSPHFVPISQKITTFHPKQLKNP